MSGRRAQKIYDLESYGNRLLACIIDMCAHPYVRGPRMAPQTTPRLRHPPRTDLRLQLPSTPRDSGREEGARHAPLRAFYTARTRRSLHPAPSPTPLQIASRTSPGRLVARHTRASATHKASAAAHDDRRPAPQFCRKELGEGAPRLLHSPHSPRVTTRVAAPTRPTPLQITTRTSPAQRTRAPHPHPHPHPQTSAQGTKDASPRAPRVRKSPARRYTRHAARELLRSESPRVQKRKKKRDAPASVSQSLRRRRAERPKTAKKNAPNRMVRLQERAEALVVERMAAGCNEERLKDGDGEVAWVGLASGRGGERNEREEGGEGRGRGVGDEGKRWIGR
ncbi:hypothetical protein B0H17DRAFT_674787 [Mycena rosella]|uniref:Uncharacterized protein n=1 Tax=Mycena rosella TaxID=1033263 RepID=A0AAD7DDU9_MYCRO|nr:hypothetical protein B0H17DRAFT_674787 [Mycena rosella]